MAANFQGAGAIEVRMGTTIQFEMFQPPHFALAEDIMESGDSLQDTTAFARVAVRESFRVLIRSTCTLCGASSVVSKADGSLDKWEDEHVCEPKTAGMSWNT
jgi:hypothetical protein